MSPMAGMSAPAINPLLTIARREILPCIVTLSWGEQTCETFSPFFPHRSSKMNINCGFWRERFSVSIAVRSPTIAVRSHAPSDGSHGEEPVAKLLRLAPYSLRPLRRYDEVGAVVGNLLRKRGHEASACKIGREKNAMGQCHAGAGSREF